MANNLIITIICQTFDPETCLTYPEYPENPETCLDANENPNIQCPLMILQLKYAKIGDLL